MPMAQVPGILGRLPVATLGLFNEQLGMRARKLPLMLPLGRDKRML